jgi:hydroxypyruvate isomerase
MLFAELPFAQRPAAAKRAGFRAVETWWPESDDVAKWVSEIRANGLEVACLNSHGGNLSAGDRGFLNLPSRYEQTVEDFAAALRLATQVGAKNINVLIGRRSLGSSFSEQIDCAVATLRDLAPLAKRAGVKILLEPINEIDVPGYLVPSAREAAALIERVGPDHVGLLYDAYHAARSGTDPYAEVVTFIDLIGHVQFADCPGRGAPGTGSLDFWRLVDGLGDAGYKGAVGLEFNPEGPTPAALAFLRGRCGF